MNQEYIDACEKRRRSVENAEVKAFLRWQK